MEDSGIEKSMPCIQVALFCTGCEIGIHPSIDTNNEIMIWPCIDYNNRYDPFIKLYCYLQQSSSSTTMYSRQSQLKDKLKNRMRARKKSEAFSTDVADQSIIAAAVMEVISKDLVNQSESISVRGKESDSPSVGSKFSDGEMKLSLKIAQERLKQEMTKEQQQSEQLNIASLKQVTE